MANPYLKSNDKKFPSHRFRIILGLSGTKIVRSNMLRQEFKKGRVPLYYLDPVMMNEAEKIYAGHQPIWITKKIFSFPVEHRMIVSEIGTKRVGFQLWKTMPTLPPFRRKFGLLYSMMIIANTGVTTSELDVLKKALLFNRLLGNRKPFPFTKMIGFDQGIVCLDAMDQKTKKALGRYGIKEMKKLDVELTQTAVNICNRFLQKIENHPEFDIYEPILHKKMEKWINISP